MCGKNPFCEETDPETCSECYEKYLKEKQITTGKLSPIKQIKTVY